MPSPKSSKAPEWRGWGADDIDMASRSATLTGYEVRKGAAPAHPAAAAQQVPPNLR